MTSSVEEKLHEQTHRINSYRVCETKMGWRLGGETKWPASNIDFKACCSLQKISNQNIPPPEGKQKVLNFSFPVFPVLTPSPFCFSGLIIPSAGADWCLSTVFPFNSLTAPDWLRSSTFGLLSSCFHRAVKQHSSNCTGLLGTVRFCSHPPTPPSLF